MSRERSAPLDAIGFERQVDQGQLPVKFASDLKRWKSRSGMVKIITGTPSRGAETLSTAAAVVGSPRSAPNGRNSTYRASYLLEGP